MSTGLRVPITQAMTAAATVVAMLGPACHRIEVAGSIRRGRADVGDIEIVAIPALQTEPDGMFAERTVNLLTEKVTALVDHGYLATHPTDPKRGDRYSKLVEPNSGLQVDLFSATADTFGLIFLIRTGPADYSHRFVTDLRRHGLHAASGELHRGSLGCGAYVCERIPTPEEEDVYAAADLFYTEPVARS